MKQLLLFTIGYLLLNNLQAQVGIGIANPNPSAQLDITSVNRGILIPRMTQAERDGIVAPATGLLIYQTNGTPGFYYYNTGWQPVAAAGWLLNGNAGTSNVHFLGTTDNIPLTFKLNGQFAGKISPNESSMSLGYQSLAINTGTDNTAIGYQALQRNTTGVRQTGIGYQALSANTTSWHNTGVGWRVLYSTTNGGYNTALGSEALYNNISGNDNTALGYQALLNNANGMGNVAIGNKVSLLNTAGGFNTALGYETLGQTTTGSNNIALGYRALSNNITGHTNIAIGANAGGIANNLSATIAMGVGASSNSLSATAIGENSKISSESSNAIAIGTGATINSTLNASGSIAIGHSAAVHSTTGTDVSNSIALGAGVVLSTRNTVNIGNSTIQTISGRVNWSTYSDGRVKEAIQEDIPGLSFITNLRPVSYVVNNVSLANFYYKDHPLQAAAFKPTIEKSNKRETGFIAQEVEKAATAIGYKFSGIDAPATADGLYSLRYSEFVVPLVKAVQEQQALIETQDRKIEKMEQQMNHLVKEIEQIKKKL